MILWELLTSSIPFKQFLYGPGTYYILLASTRKHNPRIAKPSSRLHSAMRELPLVHTPRAPDL
jgi:hypothetical protein